MRSLQLSFFVALLAASLPGCFASTGPEGECDIHPCPAGEVLTCPPGSTDCEEVSWCGMTAFCVVEEPPLPPGCGPRPVCGDSIEVESCAGWDNCFPTDWCGETIYCASNNACTAPVYICAPDEETSDVPCGPSEGGCHDAVVCGETTACRIQMDCSDPIFDPCHMATSQVVGGGIGMCPDFGDGVPCYETRFCGDLHHCVTACPDGAQQVASPRECRSSGDCYPVDHGRDDLPLFWCQGNGPSCRATPTCDAGGEEIPLNSPCPQFSFCDYRSTCSTTIQCAWPEVVVG